MGQKQYLLGRITQIIVRINLVSMGQEFNQVKESFKWIERKYAIEMMKKADI